MGPLRVINIRYLNSILFRGLAKDPLIDYREGFPAECAAALLQRDVDIALLPLSSILKHGFYKMLPFGVVAKEVGQTIYLFAERPIEELSTIILDEYSETTVVLLKAILAEFYPDTYSKLHFRTDTPQRILTSIGADVGGLIIGDLGFANAGSFPLSLDLAEFWYEKTGTPFLFAVWAYRPGQLSREHYELFVNRIQRGFVLKEMYARDWAESLGLDREKAMRYVAQTISYDITPPVIEGLVKFVEFAAQRALLPAEFLYDYESAFEFDPESETNDAISGSKRPRLEVAVEEGLAYRRLSIAAACELVRSCSPAELNLLTYLRKDIRRESFPKPGRLFRISLNRHTTFTTGMEEGFHFGDSAVLSRDAISELLSKLPGSGILVLECTRSDETTFDFFEELISWIRSQTALKIGALTVNDIQNFSHEEHLPIEEILGRLTRAGLDILVAKTDMLLANRPWEEPLRYLETLRIASKLGLGIVTGLKIASEQRIEDWGIHLYHLRQLQDQTSAVIAHIVEGTFPLNRTYRQDESATTFAKAVALSELMLDRIGSIAVSPLGYGAPLAEILLEIGADQVVVEL